MTKALCKISFRKNRGAGVLACGFAGRPARLFPFVLAALVPALLFSCAVGPDYKRPSLDVPSAYRPAEAKTNVLQKPPSLAAAPYWEVFHDPHLNACIREGLTNNYDIQIAAARVWQAQAAAAIVRSAFFPNIFAQADWSTTRLSRQGPTPVPAGFDPQINFQTVGLAMPAYEVDLWGKLRRANQAAQARLLSSVAAQQTVRQSLVAQIAASYFSLQELDAELEIARRTLTNGMDSLNLTRVRESGGVSSLQDVRQAEAFVHTAQAAVVDAQRRIEQNENEICFLLGRNPWPVSRNSWSGERMPPAVRTGLPSSLLEMRPDIRDAEERLIAANANIGVAKAAFFPEITLTGAYGFESIALSDLFTGPAKAWQFGPALSLPLFTGGRLVGTLNQAKAQFNEALAAYRRTVQGAFREVSDALIEYQRTQEFYQRQRELTEAYGDAVRLAMVRYKGGVTSYLEVLYNQQKLFDGELALALSRRNELLSVVQVYRALGGGWQETPPPVAAPRKSAAE